MSIDDISVVIYLHKVSLILWKLIHYFILILINL